MPGLGHPWPPLCLHLRGRAGRAEPCCRPRSLEAERPEAPALLLARPPLPGTADTLAPSRPARRATAAQEGSQPGAGDTCSRPESSPCASRCGRPCSAHARLSPTHAWAAATQEMEVGHGGPAPPLALAQGRVPARTSWALGPDLARPPCGQPPPALSRERQRAATAGDHGHRRWPATGRVGTNGNSCGGEQGSAPRNHQKRCSCLQKGGSGTWLGWSVGQDQLERSLHPGRRRTPRRLLGAGPD